MRAGGIDEVLRRSDYLAVTLSLNAPLNLIR
jgi:hypothetical protein